jgi:hypothetical protein
MCKEREPHICRADGCFSFDTFPYHHEDPDRLPYYYCAQDMPKPPDPVANDLTFLGLKPNA